MIRPLALSLSLSLSLFSSQDIGIINRRWWLGAAGWSIDPPTHTWPPLIRLQQCGETLEYYLGEPGSHQGQ
ncbi:hypothetical protein IWZ03DRAFT_368997 [Phyllosticta citriasiana]|uniref:Uncharacterized protein n=1 Tax=Phyllosticta citriasiana TaxID=595635 RepID=A0ABR1KTT2_9PEZI